MQTHTHTPLDMRHYPVIRDWYRCLKVNPRLTTHCHGLLMGDDFMVEYLQLCEALQIVVLVL